MFPDLDTHLPPNLEFVPWVFRAMKLLALCLIVLFIWIRRKELTTFSAAMFLFPVLTLIGYYIYIIFAEHDRPSATWETLWFQFGLTWFFLGISAVMSLKRPKEDLYKQDNEVTLKKIKGAKED